MSILLDTFLKAECSKTEQLFFQTQLICAFFFLKSCSEKQINRPLHKIPQSKTTINSFLQSLSKTDRGYTYACIQTPHSRSHSPLRLLHGLLCALPVFTWQSFLTSISLFFFLSHTILLTIWFSKSMYLISTSTSDSVQKGIGKLQPLLFQTDCKLRNRKYKLQLVLYSGTQDITGRQQIAFEQNPKLSYV